MSRRHRVRVLALLLGAGLPLQSLARGGRGTLRLYRANGRYAGRIEPNGRYYGENGRYLGRVEGNRIYSAQGRYLGRFEETGAFHEPATPAPVGSRIGTAHGDEATGTDRAIEGAHPGIGRAPAPQAPSPTGPDAPSAAASAPAPGTAPTPGSRPVPAALSSAPAGAGTSLIEVIRPEHGVR